MRAAFLGTPSAAVPALAALTTIAEVPLVITRPDAPRGRSGRPAPPAVKVAARDWGIELAQPTDDRELVAALRARALDVAVVVAYGRILTRVVRETTRVGFVNLHFSLLPRWRGAAPVERSILAGDETTGVSLMVLDDGLDTGPILAERRTEIDEVETAGTLTGRLAGLGAGLLVNTLPEFLSGVRLPAQQFDGGATSAPRLTTAEAEILSSDGPDAIVRKVRAYNPRPGAWLSIDGQRLKIWAASESDYSAEPGMLRDFGGTPVLGVESGSVALDLVQAAGKRITPGADWWRGHRAASVKVDPSPS